MFLLSNEANNFQCLQVRKDLKLKPAFPGISMPGPQQRAELLRIAELNTYGPPANSTPLPPPPSSSRESSQERDATAAADTSPYEALKKSQDKLKQRQYPCQTCGKIFTSASNRNMHQRIHKGVRPFQCTPCGVFFRQKAHLQKHQKTQGHVQATEIYEKKKREGLLNGNNEQQENMEAESVKSEDTSSSFDVGSSYHQTVLPDSATASAGNLPLLLQAADLVEEAKRSGTPIQTLANRTRSSPKRKQAKPQYYRSEGEETRDSDDEPDGNLVVEEEDKVKAFIEYNDVSHGYDCRHCSFASHDLAALKEHAREEHLTVSDDLYRCTVCQISFAREFHLRVHNRKHESTSMICDLCDQDLVVPNKLIRHLEHVHNVCPTCGVREDDRATLLKHQEEAHPDEKAGILAKIREEQRAAKMRKVDSLAEVIRQKQLELQQSSSPTATTATLNHQTSLLNGNEPTLKSPVLGRKANQRKSDISAVKALLAKTPEPIVNSTTPHHMMQDLLRKSENNNILSSLKLLPPTVRLPTQPVAGLTPPSSPPPQQTEAKVSVTIVPTNLGSVQADSDSEEEDTGLDLSMSSKRVQQNGNGSSDENEVSTTVIHKDEPMTRLPPLPSAGNGAAPGPGSHAFPPFPFFGSLLPPVPPPSVPSKSGLPAPNPYTVLSAMLGHPNPYQPVFPGMSAPSAAAAAAAGLFPSSTSPPKAPVIPNGEPKETTILPPLGKFWYYDFLTGMKCWQIILLTVLNWRWLHKILPLTNLTYSLIISHVLKLVVFFCPFSRVQAFPLHLLQEGVLTPEQPRVSHGTHAFRRGQARLRHLRQELQLQVEPHSSSQNSFR